MLRLTNIKRLGFALKGPGFYPAFTPKRFFAAESELKDDKPETETEERGDKEGESINLRDLEKSTSFEPTAERGRLISRLPLADRERLRFYKKELDFRNTHPNIGPFDFQVDLSKANEEVLASLQNREIADYDATRDIRSKINAVVRKLEDPEDESMHELCSKIHDFINLAFQNGVNDPITERDFRTVIMLKEFQPFLKVFFNPAFLDSTTNYVGVQEFNYILKEVANDSSYLPLIEFVKVLRSTESKADKKSLFSLNLKAAKEFMDTHRNANDYNYMAYIYHVFNVSRGSFLESIDFDEFTTKLVNLYWGKGLSKKNREIFSNHLYDVLFVKLHVKENTSLQYFLADMFLTAPSFNDGLEALALTTAIFARLLNTDNPYCNDLLADFKKRFGEEKFNYYIKTKLPAVFNMGRRKNLAQQAKKAIDAFVSTKNPDTKNRIVSIFDQNYYEPGAVIFYSHDNNTGLDFHSYIGKRKVKTITQENFNERELITKAVVYGDNYSFLRLFKNEVESDFASKEVFDSVYSKYSGNPDKVSTLPPKIMPKFINEFFDQLENVDGYSTAKFQTTLTNPTRRSQDYEIQSGRRVDDEDIGVEPEIEAAPVEGGEEVPAETKKATPKAAKLKGGVRAFSTYIKRGLTYTPQRFFSGKKEEGEIEVEVDIAEDELPPLNQGGESPFKKFVKKIEEVDSAKDSKLSKEDVAKMKGILFEEGNKEAESKPTRDKSPKKIFTKPTKKDKPEPSEREKSSDKITFAKIAVAETPKYETAESTPITFSNDYWLNVIKDKRELREIHLLLENHFFTMNDLILCQNAIYDFIKKEPLLHLGVQSAQQTIYKMFHQPEIARMTQEEADQLGIRVKPSEVELQPDPKLETSIDTNYGKMSKDYNKYLKATVFPFSIGDLNYRSLLLYVQKNYKRLHFKRIISHIARYSTDISKENLALIADICYEQRIGLSLVEVAHLFIQNRIIHTEDQLKIVVERLKYFKDLADNSEYLARAFSEYNNAPFTINLLLPHLKMLVEYKKDDRFMPIFDRTKDYLNNRKLKYEDHLSQEENVKRQEEYRNQSRAALAQFYRDFIKLLNQHGIYSFSRLLYKEQNELKMINSIEDYINGIYCYKDSEDELRSFVRRAKEDPDAENTAKLTHALLEVFSEDPVKHQKYLEDINENLILQDKVYLNPDAINNVISSLMRAKLYAGVGKFLNHLIKKPVPMKSNTKVLCYRLLNASKDEISKPHLLGLVDKLFSEDVQERLKERSKEAKEAKKKKEKGPVEAVSLDAVTPAQEKAEAEGKEKAESKKEKGSKKDKKAAAETAEDTREVKETKEAEPEKEISEEELYEQRYSKLRNSAEKIFSRHHKRRVLNDRVNLQKFAVFDQESSEAQPESK